MSRKNHYGSKSLRGTEVAALFYSRAVTLANVTFPWACRASLAPGALALWDAARQRTITLGNVSFP